MSTDNSISAIKPSHMLAEKAAKLLTGGSLPPASGPTPGEAHADETPEDAMLEVLECHQ